MQAKDIMTVNVISVSEDTPIHEVVRLLLKYRISAVPVVDGGRKVVHRQRGRPAAPRGSGPRWHATSVVAGGGLRRPNSGL